jgi:hypothetical protein
MRPSKTKKKTTVWKKNPRGVGHPPFAIVKNEPKSDWVSLKVSGHAIKKNTRALYSEYFALRPRDR